MKILIGGACIEMTIAQCGALCRGGSKRIDLLVGVGDQGDARSQINVVLN